MLDHFTTRGPGQVRSTDQLTTFVVGMLRAGRSVTLERPAKLNPYRHDPSAWAEERRPYLSELASRIDYSG